MKPKFLLLLLFFTAAGLCTHAQTVRGINIQASKDGTAIASVELELGDVRLCTDFDGNFTINTNRRSGQALNHRLQMVYFDRFDNEKSGKLKAIGGIKIDYYDRFDEADLLGKVKVIGNTTFSYNDQFDPVELRGQLKSIGNLKITYYDKFDNDNIGKVKTIGATKIIYYDRFDPEELRGRIKAIEGDSTMINF